MPRDYSSSVPRWPDNIQREEDFLAAHQDAVIERQRPADSPPLYTAHFRDRDIQGHDLGRVLDTMEAVCGGTDDCKCPARQPPAGQS